MPLKYAYANARIKGMKSHLLSEATVKEMLEVGSISEIIEILEESPAYRDSFVECGAKNLSGMGLVSTALHDNLRETLKKILKFLPKRGREDFRIIVGELEILDLKNILAKKLLGQGIDECELVGLGGENRAFFKKIADAKDVKSALEALKESEQYSEVFSETLLEEYEKTGDYRIFVDALNDYYYGRLASLAEREKDASVAAIINARLDYLNTTMILRAKKNGLNEEETRKHLIPFVTKRVDKLLKAENLGGCFAVLEKEIGRIPFDETLVSTEISLEKKFIEKAIREFRLSTLGFAVVLGYYYMKTTEIANIRKIAFATEYGIKKELKEREMVFAVNV